MNSEKQYGYSICPLKEGQSCADFDRLGTIACGICGADKELAKEGQENFYMDLNGCLKANKIPISTRVLLGWFYIRKLNIDG